MNYSKSLMKNSSIENKLPSLVIIQSGRLLRSFTNKKFVSAKSASEGIIKKLLDNKKNLKQKQHYI